MNLTRLCLLLFLGGLLCAPALAQRHPPAATCKPPQFGPTVRIAAIDERGCVYRRAGYRATTPVVRATWRADRFNGITVRVPAAQYRAVLRDWRTGKLALLFPTANDLCNVYHDRTSCGVTVEVRFVAPRRKRR